MAGTGVIDIFAEAGLEKPDISLIDDEFVKKFEPSEQKNLQLEAVKRLLSNEVKVIGKRNVVAGRKFSEMLADSPATATRTAPSTPPQVIAEIVELAKAPAREQRTRRADRPHRRRTRLLRRALRPTSPPSMAMQDETMQKIAHELTEIVRRDAKTDWNVKETGPRQAAHHHQAAAAASTATRRTRPTPRPT